MGNVFAYPAGEKAPVQLGAAENRIGKMSPVASEPVTPETFPEPAVKPLTGLRKWLRRLTFGLMYRKQARAIRHARASHSRFVEALRGHGPGRETAIAAEKKRLEEIREEQREKVRKRRMKSLVESEKIAVQKKEHGLRNHLSIFKAEPEFLLELEKEDGKQGIYTKDHFKDLTVFSKSAPVPDPESGKQHAHEVFDQQAIRIGNTGKALTDEEFAAVSIYAAMDPEVTFRAWQKKPDRDPTLEQALQNVGFSGREVASIIGSSIQTMGTTDNFDEHGRDSEGAYFKDIADVGRKKAAEAFRAYGAGDLQPLAKLLGEAVNLGTSAFHSFNGTKLEYNSYGLLTAAKPILALLEKDPALEAAARNAGMKPERLQSLKGLVKMNELDTEAKKAALAVTQAGADGTDLPREKKAEYAKKVVMSRLALLRLTHAGNRICNGEDERIARQMNRVGKDVSLRGQPRTNEMPAPKPGTVHACSYDNVLDGIRQTFAEPHAVTMELATKKGCQGLEALTEQIVEQEKLADKDLAQLADEISAYGSFQFNLAAIAEKAMQTMQEGKSCPEPGKEPQPGPEPIRKPLQSSAQSLQGPQV